MLLKRLAAALLLAASTLCLHPLAQAATRQGDPVQVCVLSPRVEPVDEGDAWGEVPVAAPTLLVVEPLQLVRFESLEGRLLWSRRATAGRPLPALLPWPVAPLRPGQQVVLRLQPLGAADDAFAHVRLQAAGPVVLAATAALIQTLGGALTPGWRRSTGLWKRAMCRWPGRCSMPPRPPPVPLCRICVRRSGAAVAVESGAWISRWLGNRGSQTKGPAPQVPGLRVIDQRETVTGN